MLIAYAPLALVFLFSLSAADRSLLESLIATSFLLSAIHLGIRWQQTTQRHARSRKAGCGSARGSSSPNENPPRSFRAARSSRKLSFILRRWEPIVFWLKPGADPLIENVPPFNDFLYTVYNDVNGGSWTSRHLTPKIRHACRTVIKRHTAPGALVVDPFCGLGGVPEACVLEGRNFLGIDRSLKYVKDARRRLQMAMGGVRKCA
jgi:hypothetical protein